MKQAFCSIIIVTYNSQKHLPKAMECLAGQSRQADQIILVDTGSKDPGYLDAYKQQKNVSVTLGEKESGFCKGNNLGFSQVSKDCDYVFLLNPDAFLTPGFLHKAIEYMEREENQNVGAITGISLGFDIEAGLPTGKYDSTGVFQKWYGKWHDRAQGQQENRLSFSKEEDIPAICGAVFFCRKKALDQVLIRKTEILDSTYYMYKEDIDLSLRLKKKGWQLRFVPELIAYHCRGWNPDRKKIARKYRLCSARNELRIQARLLNPFAWVYSSLKFCAVKMLDV